MKICILSLDQEYSENFKNYLENKGEEVIGTSSSGRFGLTLIKEKKPDVVLSDMVLGGIDGVDLVREISKLTVSPKLIFASYLTDKRIINRLLSLGASYYILLPKGFDTVYSRICEVSKAKGDSEYTKRSPKTIMENKTNPKSNINELDRNISKIFLTIGLSPQQLGYQYLREAIKEVIIYPSAINQVTKFLYPYIAKRYDSTPTKVERAMRHTLDSAWNKGRISQINNVFGVKIFSGNDKPSNSEFIALVADKLLVEGAISYVKLGEVK